MYVCMYVLISPCTVIFDGPLSYNRLQKLGKKRNIGLHVQDFETSILAPTDYEIVAIYLKTRRRPKAFTRDELV